MRDVLLVEDYLPRSQLVVPEHHVGQAKYVAIDAHVHLGYRRGGWAVEDVEALVDRMDQCNVQALVNLDGGIGDQLKRNLERYREPYPDRFAVLMTPDWATCARSGWEEKLPRQLEEAMAAGADGMKIFKSLGLRVRDERGDLLRVDDERLDPLWAKAGELGAPVLIHIADPVAFFTPLDRFNERWDELHGRPNWSFYQPQYPTFDDLMEQQANLLAKHPETTFQSAHVASYAENLQWVGELLDAHPNLNVDISERAAELGRQPYTAREWFIKYQDRIVFGTDRPPLGPWYEIYFRFLETFDEYFPHGPEQPSRQGRWNIYGIGLPDEVLEKIYRKNAEKIYPRLAQAEE
jgi:predicted TIM-barrel fold metal-dependent hydrolase